MTNNAKEQLKNETMPKGLIISILMWCLIIAGISKLIVTEQYHRQETVNDAISGKILKILISYDIEESGEMYFVDEKNKEYIIQIEVPYKQNFTTKWYKVDKTSWDRYKEGDVFSEDDCIVFDKEIYSLKNTLSVIKEEVNMPNRISEKTT